MIFLAFENTTCRGTLQNVFRGNETRDAEATLAALRAVPEFKEMIAKYSLHKDIVANCWRAINKINLGMVRANWEL